MRCQICNRETDNYSLNKLTGKYESICSRCRVVIRDTNSYYQSFNNCDSLDEMPKEEFLDYLREVDYNDKGVSKE